MRYGYFLLIYTLFFASPVLAQQSLDYKTRWLIKPAIGYNLPISKMQNIIETDHLFRNETAYYIQPFAGSFFFSKHWGVELVSQIGLHRATPSREERFEQLVGQEYGRNYFITRSAGFSHPASQTYSAGVDVWLGAVYRYEHHRLFMHPSLRIGTTYEYTQSYEAFLKEKNSNNLSRLSYSGGDDLQPRRYFAVSGAVSTGYKVSKRISLNLDVSAISFRRNATASKTVEDLYTGVSTVENRQYQNLVTSFNVGTGVTMNFYRAKDHKVE